MDELHTLGERIKFARTKAGLSQDALAKLIPAKTQRVM